MRKLILIVTIISVSTAYADFAKCGPNEVLDECPSDCSDHCPTRDGEFINCSRPDWNNCPPPKCKCQFNYRRAQNGTCIPTEDCPAFECPKPNEEYNPCPSYCPTDDCSQATPNGECPQFGLFIIAVECYPRCRCKPTYWRKDGVCVPYQNCDDDAMINLA